jgi:VIT1/CCC1 family predicted Fe2+/Mn2+ transporter
MPGVAMELQWLAFFVRHNGSSHVKRAMIAYARIRLHPHRAIFLMVGRVMTAHIHRSSRTGWLRAGVLGANDGVLSISSLMLGVATAHSTPGGVLIAACAGLVAGALSMGAGEYVSVSSQADTERSDIEIERHSLQHHHDAERMELRDIYVRRGLDHELATQVAQQLMAHDALGAHVRDDIGIMDATAARPMQAAMTSSASFALGGIFPLLTGVIRPGQPLIIAMVSLFFLAVLGTLAARAGGAPVLRGAARVLIWGALVMAVTAALGAFVGTVLH